MERYRVSHGTGFRLGDHDPADTGGFDGGKSEAKAELAKLTDRLGELQEMLYAERTTGVLVVLQGMDTSGKGGVIRKVFEGMDPSGVRVASFKAPTEPELAHDFLWRIHPHVPGRGEVTIFDRSHYEEVLIVRVHDLVPKDRWEARYEHIRAFERMLVDEGTVVLKFLLHISSATQRERLQARLDDPTKHWKFRLGDVAEREHWDAYQDAYQDMVRQTATPEAPWYVVPADRKWFRNLVVCRTAVAALEGLDLRWPESEDDLTGVELP
ncbi:MAG TPA: polyphosphate kinase 2 family protein [Acidimicrobiales bacterium]